MPHHHGFEEGSAARKLETPEERVVRPRPSLGERQELAVGEEEIRRAMERADKRKVEDIRERMGPSRDRLMFQSGLARDKAEIAIIEFRNALATKKLTDQDMEDWGERLAETRDALEDLNNEMRRVPAGQLKTGDIMNENFRTIAHIQDAIAASKEENPKDALMELMHGAGVLKVEREKEEKGLEAAETAKEIEAKIKEQYGMHPEELTMKGSGWRGLKFRTKNVLAHLSFQKSLYDQWRDAKTAEETGARGGAMRKLHEARVRPTPEAKQAKEEILADEEAARQKALEREAGKNREFAVKVFSRERAASIWDTVKTQLELMKERSFTAEDYVVMAAKYVDAFTQDRRGGIADYGAAWEEMNRALGYTNESNPVMGGGLSRPAETRRRKQEEARRAAEVSRRKTAEMPEERAQAAEEEEPEIEIRGPGVEEERPSRVRLKKGAKVLKPAPAEAEEKFLKEAAGRWTMDRAGSVIGKVKDDAVGTIRTIEALVTKKISENPKRSAYLMGEMKGYPIATSLEDAYIYAIAKYLEDRDAEREHLRRLTDRLGINNAWINSILAEPVGPEDVLKGTRQRRETVSKQTKRWKF